MTTTATRQKKWRCEVVKLGHLVMVDVKATRRELRRLKKCGWTQTKVAAEVGCTQQHISYVMRKAQTVDYRLADKIHMLWFDVCAPLERDGRRWPIEPYRAAVIERYGSTRVLPGGRRLLISKGLPISTKQAEDAAEGLGMVPSDIWPDWYLV